MAQKERRMSEVEREEKRRQNVIEEVISLQRALEGAPPLLCPESCAQAGALTVPIWHARRDKLKGRVDAR